MSAENSVKFPRTDALLINDVSWKSPPSQNAAEYPCWEMLGDAEYRGLSEKNAATYTEMAFPGSLSKIPRSKISRGVNRPMNAAPCSETGPSFPPIPTASATGPATEIQSGTYASTDQLLGRSPLLPYKSASFPTSIRSSTTPDALTSSDANALTIAFAMLTAFVTLFAPRLTPHVMCVPYGRKRESV